MTGKISGKIMKAALYVSAVFAATAVAASAQRGVPFFQTFNATADSVTMPPPQQISIGTPAGSSSIAFKFGGVSSVTATGNAKPADFIVVSPSIGTAPTVGWVGLNPSLVPYLPPGEYILDFSFVDPSGSVFFQTTIDLMLKFPPPPSISAVLSAAALQPTISPGEMVSIFGTNLSTPPLSGQLNDAGLLPMALDNTTVTFNGFAAPLMYVSNTQINTLVPYSVAGQTSVDVVVARTYNPMPASSPFSVPLTDAAPGIFTVGQMGSGQGAILNAACADP